MKKEDLNNKKVNKLIRGEKSIMATDRQIIYTFLGMISGFLIGDRIIKLDIYGVLVFTFIFGLLAYIYSKKY